MDTTGRTEADDLRKRCAACGSRVHIQRCGACQVAGYCSKDCQKTDWGSHKRECKRLKRIKNGPKITWDELEAMYPMTALGHTLEVVLTTTPDGIEKIRSAVQCRDSDGRTCLVAFYLSESEPPKGIVAGAVLRWHNPEFHYFVFGQVGARIEDHCLEDVCIGPF